MSEPSMSEPSMSEPSMSEPSTTGPAPASAAQRVLAQARFETSVLLHNGEQLLVAIVLPALALVGLVAVLGIAVGGALRLRTPAAPTPSIDELAAAAAATPDQVLASGQYLYRTERASDGGAPPTMTSQWTATDGTGQRVVAALQIGAPGQTSPSLSVYPEPGCLQFARLSYDQLRNLPSNPEALVQQLRDLGASDGTRPTDDARALADVLALAVTPPDVAAAAVQALEQIGGAVVGTVSDGAGRFGTGVRGIDPDGHAWLVVLDPATGRAIAFEPNWTSSSTSLSRVWIDQGVTEGLPS